MAPMTSNQNKIGRTLWGTKKETGSLIYAIIDTARAPLIYPKLAESNTGKPAC